MEKQTKLMNLKAYLHSETDRSALVMRLIWLLNSSFALSKKTLKTVEPEMMQNLFWNSIQQLITLTKSGKNNIKQKISIRKAATSMCNVVHHLPSTTVTQLLIGSVFYYSEIRAGAEMC